MPDPNMRWPPRIERSMLKENARRFLVRPSAVARMKGWVPAGLVRELCDPSNRPANPSIQGRGRMDRRAKRNSEPRSTALVRWKER